MLSTGGRDWLWSDFFLIINFSQQPLYFFSFFSFHHCVMSYDGRTWRKVFLKFTKALFAT